MSRQQTNSDEQLATRVQAGCQSSFEELVRRHQTTLLHFLIARRMPRDQTEDLLQESFLQAFRSISSFDPSRRFSTWLFTIAKRLASKRSTQCETQLDDRFDCSTRDDQIADRELTEQETRSAIWSTVYEQTNDDEFAALWMYYVERAPISEIGHVIGKSAAATKMLMSRTRKRLKPMLRQFIVDMDRPVADNPFQIHRLRLSESQ